MEEKAPLLNFTCDLKTVDKYSIALVEAFQKEYRKYLNKISHEDIIKFQSFNFLNQQYFDRTDIFSQDAINNCTAVEFFLLFANNLSQNYHESALKGYSIEQRFTEMTQYTTSLLSQSQTGKFKAEKYLSSTTFGIYEKREERELRYYYWIASLETKLLVEVILIIKKVKGEVDSPPTQVNTQNSYSQPNSSSDCFVVTATFGTPYAQEVIKYRHFRDKYLSQYLLGRIFIDLYSFWGPKLAAIVKKNPRLKLAMAKVLGAASQMLPEVKDYKLK